MRGNTWLSKYKTPYFEYFDRKGARSTIGGMYIHLSLSKVCFCEYIAQEGLHMCQRRDPGTSRKTAIATKRTLHVHCSISGNGGKRNTLCVKFSRTLRIEIRGPPAASPPAAPLASRMRASAKAPAPTLPPPAEYAAAAAIIRVAVATAGLFAAASDAAISEEAPRRVTPPPPPSCPSYSVTATIL